MGVAAVIGLAACGDPAISAPSGPRASVAPDGATAVLRRSCAAATKADIQARDVTFMQSAMLRQEAQLQRVADDLTGAVPNGNIPTDTQLADSNARQIVDLVEKSNLCTLFREKLLAAAQGLATADDTLAASSAGSDVAAALQAAQDRLQAVKAIIQNPPTT